MSKQCAIIPRVVNKKGEKTESRLFKDLLSFTNNRKETVRIYQITKNESFQRDWFPKLKLDEFGEPTIASMLSKTNLRSFIDEDRALKELNKQVGKFDSNGNVKKYKITDDNRKMLVDKAIDFNTKSGFDFSYVANVSKGFDKNTNKEFLTISVNRKTAMHNKDANDMTYNKILNDKLRSLMSEWGISEGALTDLENRLGINGVADFNTAKVSADGLLELIRLRDGIEGEKALPEEISHFIIEAMGNHPMINRILNYIADNNSIESLLGDSYDAYYREYNGNEAMLAKEAAGKLLAKYLNKTEETPKGLWERFINAVKSFIERFNANDIQKAMIDADNTLNQFAKDILKGSYNDEIKLDNITESAKYFNLSDRVSRDRKIVNDLIKAETKKLSIYKHRNPNKSFEESQERHINKLELFLMENKEIEAIYSYLEEALRITKQLETRLNSVNSGTLDLNEKANALRDIRNYIYSYKSTTGLIRDALLDEEIESDNRYGEKVKIDLDQLDILLSDLLLKFDKIAFPLFADFIKPFIGDNVKVPFGKNKGDVIKAEDMIKYAKRDISFFDRWLDSMADSSDDMLKVMGQAVNKSKELARLSTIKLSKQIESATIKLEQSGFKSTDFMFERDSDRNLTGNYISPINYGQYEADLKKIKEELRSKYGETMSSLEEQRYKKDVFNWIRSHTEYNKEGGVYKPKESLYRNLNYHNLKPAQKEYYNTILDIKESLDSLLPEEVTSKFSIIKIRKDLLERVKDSKDVKSGGRHIWESVKDSFIKRSDDTEFGVKSALIDFEGHAVNMLPIYYTKLKDGESMNDVSTDMASTLIAYASMANDFNEMSKIISILEVGRDLLRNRKIEDTMSGKPIVETIRETGRKIETKVLRQTESTHFMQRLNDFFEMQVYGKYMKDEGSFLGIDVAKGANLINKLTSINNLGLNVLSGISNVATGNVMMRIESIAGEFFSAKNTITADKNYSKHLTGYLGEIGKRVKTSKLALFDEMFNVMQEYEQEFSNKDFDKKTLLSKGFSTNTLFFMSNAGEHWMQNRTALALADAYKLKDSKGNIISLWDALEVKYIDPNNKALGAELVIKDGVTKKDGTQFNEDDIIKFSKKSKAINQRMHGIYNKLDRSAVQRLAIGRLGIMFRKWIKPSLNRRFSDASYNYDLEAWSEGYYTTSFRFIKQLYKDLNSSKLDIALKWNELSNVEKANIKRALTETAHFLAIAIVLGAIDWPDDKNRPWVVKMAEYQARRLYTELGVLIPGPQMINEGLTILKSPAAGINTLDNLMNTLNVFNPFAWQEELQSGRYKGHSKAFKYVMESPLVPMNRTVYKALHPETGIAFFKQ